MSTHRDEVSFSGEAALTSVCVFLAGPIITASGTILYTRALRLSFVITFRRSSFWPVVYNRPSGRVEGEQRNHLLVTQQNDSVRSVTVTEEISSGGW